MMSILLSLYRNFVVVKGAAPHYTYLSFGVNELELFTCTSHPYSARSPYQQIDIYDTVEYGTMLLLDYDTSEYVTMDTSITTTGGLGNELYVWLKLTLLINH